MPMPEIVNRRSIRSYRADAVTDEQIEQVLRAAMAAPSAGNQQPGERNLPRPPDRTLRNK